MKTVLKLFVLALVFFAVSCGGSGDKAPSYGSKKEAPAAKSSEPASTRVDLTDKGVGPITNVELAPEIDQTMASKGKEVYDKMCTACHKATKKFIGPAPKDILKRRTPEWVMNMILNPDEMVHKDALAKDLLVEFNGSPMANQNLTEEEARAVLEYFRTL